MTERAVSLLPVVAGGQVSAHEQLRRAVPWRSHLHGLGHALPLVDAEPKVWPPNMLHHRDEARQGRGWVRVGVKVALTLTQKEEGELNKGGPRTRHA